MYLLNKFEKALLDEGVAAQEFHQKMAWEGYLTYSNESFLQNYIAIKMHEKHGYPVYIDASPKRIYENDEMPSNIRFDLAFWWKHGDKPRALVEIKRVWNKEPVLADVNKIINYRDEYDDQVSGYVLYYTDTVEKESVQKAAQIVIDRFNRVNDTMHDEQYLPGLVHPVDSHICKSGNHAWGFALYRF